MKATDLSWLRPDPLWRAAPLLLLRFPALLAAILLSSAVLGAASAAGPLFVSSAGSAAVRLELERLQPEALGVSVTTYAVIDADRFQAADQQLRAAVKTALPGVGEPETLMRGTPTARLGPAGARDGTRMQFAARAGALNSLEVVDGDTTSDGIWVPKSLADGLELRHGDLATMLFSNARADVRIAGIYRDLRPPLSDYWSRLAGIILPRETPTGTQTPLPMVLANDRTFLAYGSTVGDNARTSWVFPRTPEDMTLADAQAEARAIERLELRLADPDDPLAAALLRLSRRSFELGVHSGLPGAVDRASDVIAALEPPVWAVSAGAQAIALALVGAAATFRLQRRSIETRLLLAEGVGSISQGARAALEAVPVMLVGAGAGWAAARWLVPRLAPSTLVSEYASMAALRRAGLSALAGILVVGAVSALGVARENELTRSRFRRVAAGARWEFVVIALAAAAWYRVVSAPTVRDPAAYGHVDLLLLLFPVLFIAGGVGLALRTIRRVLPRLRGVSSRRRPATYLASRRLAGASGPATLLVAAAALAGGVLVHAATLVSSAEATIDWKATLAIGAESVATFTSVHAVPDDLPPRSTVVGRQRASLLPAEARTELLIVDASSLSGAAIWHRELADQPLEDLLAALQDVGDRSMLPAILVGDIASAATLQTAQWRIPIEPVARLAAFPGMGSSRLVVVVDRDSLAEVVERYRPGVDPERLVSAEVWSPAPRAELASALREHGAVASGLTDPAMLRERADLQAVTWTFAYLRALGTAAGLLAGVGIVQYLQARQHSRVVFYALASRMGLSRSEHRRSLALEIALTLSAALALGAVLGIVAVRVVLVPLDPLPDMAGGPLLAVPWGLLGIAAIAVGTLSVVGAAIVQRSAERSRVAEVLRLAA